MLNYLTVSTHRNLIPFTTDNVFLSNPLMMLFIKRMTTVDGGATFGAPIRISRNAAGSSYRGADQLKIWYDTANTIGAEWDWSQYGRVLGVSGLDELRNTGPRAVVNLIKQSLEAVEMELREDMGTDLYGDGTSNDGKAFVGLNAVADDATNVVTYGGISRTTYVNWKAQYSANGGVGRALTQSLMNTTFQNCSKDNDRPHVGMITDGIYTKYLSMLQPQVRFGDEQSANMGYSNLLYQRRPLIVDEQIPTTGLHTMYWLNLKYFTFYTSSGRNFLLCPFQMLADQDAVAAKFLWAGQLACTRPSSQGQVRDIDVALP